MFKQFNNLTRKFKIIEIEIFKNLNQKLKNFVKKTGEKVFNE